MDEPDKPLTIKVIPAQQFYGDKGSLDNVYKNVSTPRGLLFMANFKHFDYNLMKTRHGSEADVDNLTNLFQQMGYKIPNSHNDMTKEQTIKAIREFTENQELQEVHSCIVIIMSHGDDGVFFTRDNLPLRINDDVVEKFSNSQCPALKGKPKIFIFQCCRGKSMDEGVAAIKLSSSESTDALKGQQGLQQGSHVELDDVISKDGTYTDMFIVYSTIPGYVSYRHKVSGSLLIQAVCNIFMNTAYKEDLTALMMKVSLMLREKTLECEQYKGHWIEVKQVCERLNRGFDHPFFFNPRPLGDTYDPSQVAEVLLEKALPQYHGRMPEFNTEDYYDFSHENRGICLIFNIMHFDPSTGLGVRNGSDRDCDQCEDVFKSLGFDVRIHNDLNVAQIMKEMENVANEDHTNNDCVAIVFLSHGELNLLYGYDGPFKPSTLFDKLKADVCPSLYEKPKLFFIEGDRATAEEGGSLSRGLSNAFQTERTIFSDMFICWATTPVTCASLKVSCFS